MKSKLEKVISGGQTGADMAALIAARSVGLATGGTAAEGYKTELGENSELRDVYGLSAEGSYKFRTKKNVDDADATLVLLVHKGSGGSAKTVGWAQNHRWENCLQSRIRGGHRPVLVLHAEDMEEDRLNESANRIVDFVKTSRAKTLNVAGHRQSTAFMKPFFSQAPYDYQQRCATLLSLAFSALLQSRSDGEKQANEEKQSDCEKKQADNDDEQANK